MGFLKTVQALEAGRAGGSVLLARKQRGAVPYTAGQAAVRKAVGACSGVPSSGHFAYKALNDTDTLHIKH